MDKAEGEKLLRDNAELRAQVAKLVEQIATSNELIAKLNERVGELLAAAQRRHRKPTPEKPAAPPPVVEGDARKAFEERPKAPRSPPVPSA